MTVGEYVAQIFKSINSVNESFSKKITAFQESINKAYKFVCDLSEFFEYCQLVPPQVFDFLIKIKAPLSKEEIRKLKKLETAEDRKLYLILTRKPKGKKVYNPRLFVDKETFNAIKILMDRNGNSISVESSIVYFNPKTCVLDVYGMVTYIKKDSYRYKLCKYFF
jgi:hypothetical protein